MDSTIGTSWAARVVVVTGAGSGIGAATAQRLCARGAHVVLVDQRESAAAVARNLGERATTVLADVAMAECWQTVRQACADLGRIDVLASNGARQISALVVDLDEREWEAQVAVDLTGTYRGLRALLPLLQASDGRGVIVSSVHALMGLPRHPACSAAKGALAALTRQVAVDYAPVRVNCVLPGPILTPTWDCVSDADRRRTVEAVPVKRFGQPDEVKAVIEFLGSEAASYVTGTSLVVDSGWSISKDSA
jgi:glucose 1-dehydrogenase